MKNKDIEARVKARMKTNPSDVSYKTQRVADPARADLRTWGREMREWGIRVRRDILVIEEHLKAQSPKNVLTDADFYGDPGDPPPEPIE